MIVYDPRILSNVCFTIAQLPQVHWQSRDPIQQQLEMKTTWLPSLKGDGGHRKEGCAGNLLHFMKLLVNFAWRSVPNLIYQKKGEPEQLPEKICTVVHEETTGRQPKWGSVFIACERQPKDCISRQIAEDLKMLFWVSGWKWAKQFSLE